MIAPAPFRTAPRGWSTIAASICSLSARPGHVWWLGFTDPHWSLTANAGLPVKLRFDGRAPVDAIAAIPNSQLLLVPMPDDSHLIETFKHSSQMTVNAQEPPVSLNLDGTSKVISELTNCVRNAAALETRGPAPPPTTSALQTAAAAEPPAPPGPAAPAPSAALAPRSTLVARDATELEEIRLTKSFLMAAHLPNAHLVDTDKPAALAGFRAVWRSDDAAGRSRSYHWDVT